MWRICRTRGRHGSVTSWGLLLDHLGAVSENTFLIEYSVAMSGAGVKKLQIWSAYGTFARELRRRGFPSLGNLSTLQLVDLLHPRG